MVSQWIRLIECNYWNNNAYDYTGFQNSPCGSGWKRWKWVHTTHIYLDLHSAVHIDPKVSQIIKGVLTDAGSPYIILKPLKSIREPLGPQRARKLQQKVLFWRFNVNNLELPFHVSALPPGLRVDFLSVLLVLLCYKVINSLGFLLCCILYGWDTTALAFDE